MGTPLCQGVRKARAILVCKALDICQARRTFPSSQLSILMQLLDKLWLDFGEDYLVRFQRFPTRRNFCWGTFFFRQKVTRWALGAGAHCFFGTRLWWPAQLPNSISKGIEKNICFWAAGTPFPKKSNPSFNPKNYYIRSKSSLQEQHKIQTAVHTHQLDHLQEHLN